MRVVHAWFAAAALLFASDASRAEPLLPLLPIPKPHAASLDPIPGEWIQPFGDLGFVAPPIGATEPRPVVVAVHGMGDRPEWECAAWRGIFGPRPFIICPRGETWAVNFKWRSSSQVRAAIDALLDAAQARYGAHLDRGTASTPASPKGRSWARRWCATILVTTRTRSGKKDSTTGSPGARSTTR